MNLDQLSKQVDLMKAVNKGDLIAVGKLLNSGADVNFVNLYGKSNTPLHQAVFSGNTQMVQFLLAKGAENEVKNVDGKKPIDFCSLLNENLKQEIRQVFDEHLKKNNPIKNKQRTQIESNSGIKTFMKRPGTAAVGQYYETKLLTFVLFRLLHDERVESFYLGNNLDESGAFDDIVFKACVQGKSRVVCLQAKHKTGKNRVNFEDLINAKDKKGDFNLFKYFDSYLEIRNMFSPTNRHSFFHEVYKKVNLDLIIFTPAEFNYPEEAQCENTINNDILYTNKSGRTVKFKGMQKVKETLIRTSKEWHKKVVAGILARLIEQHGYDTNNIYKAIEKVKENVLRENINKTESFNSSSLLHLYGNQVVRNFSNRNQILHNNIERILEEPLLPSAEEHNILVEDFFEKLRFYSEQATEDVLEDIIKNEMKNQQYERYHLIFLELHKAVENWWKQSGEVEYLTKNCKVFKDVVNKVELEKVHFESLFRVGSSKTNFRIRGLKLVWINVMEEIENEENIFVNFFNNLTDFCCVKIIQYFQTNCIEFRFVIFDEDSKIATSDIVETFCESNPQCFIVVYFPSINKKVVDRFRETVKKLVIITEHEYKGEWRSVPVETNGIDDLEIETQVKLLEFYEVTFQGQSIPLGRLMHRAPYDLIDANTLKKIVDGEKLLISKKWFSNVDEDYSNMYIERKLKDHKNKRIFLRSFTDYRDKTLIIAAEPGMGKSTLLKQIYSETKKSRIIIWPIGINLLDYSKQFSQWNESTSSYEEKAFNFLMEAVCCESNDQSGRDALFESKLFRWYYENSKIFLLFDGFDEISPYYTDIVLQLLKYYHHNFTAKLWVATRCGAALEQLVRSLKVPVYTLEEFSNEDAKEFLWLFWKTKLGIGLDKRAKFEGYVKQLFSYLSETDGGLDLIHVPLQIKMIAMTFEDDFSKLCNSSGVVPRFEKIDLFDLYEKFIYLKFYHVMMQEKNRIDYANPINKHIIEDQFKKFNKKHRIAAVYALFDSSDVPKLLNQIEIYCARDFLKDIQNLVEKTGIITRVDDGIPKFMHRTYAEFFVAPLIWEKYCFLKNTEFEIFVQAILINNLLKNGRAQIAKFLLLYAQKEYLICFNISNKTCLLIQMLFDLPNTIASRALSAVLGLVEYSICTHSECFNKIKSLISKTVNERLHLILYNAYESKYEYLLKALEDINPLFFAVEINNLDLVNYFIDRGVNVNEPSDCSFRIETFLGSKTELSFRVGSRAKYTPLHLAARMNYTEIIKLLINNGASINCKTSHGDTPLNLAESYRAAEAAELLKKLGGRSSVRKGVFFSRL